MSERFEVRAGVRRRVRQNLFWLTAPIVVFGGIGTYLYAGKHQGILTLVLLLGLGIVATIMFVGSEVIAGRTELVVEAPGIRLGEAKVPWPSIWQVVVVGAPDVRALGIRLRRGAPLPDGVRCVVYDPREVSAPHVRRTFRNAVVDRERLTAAVRAFAPPDVELLDRDRMDETRGPYRPPDVDGGRQDAPAVVTGVRMHDYSSTSSKHFTYKPHPVVSFVLPDGRHVIAETSKPGIGQPGEQVLVSYDASDPADVWVHGGKPRSIRRWTSF